LPRAVGAAPAGAPVDPGRAVLGSGLALRGEISGEGDFHIYGRFEGEIDVTGRVVVSEAAQVDANINAASIVIAGKVRGNLSATTHLDILPSGVLTGTLKAGSFSAAEGSSVKGELWLERAEPARAGEADTEQSERRL
jgi:cytoskeletal protein CcmA (bactofilin family)